MSRYIVDTEVNDEAWECYIIDTQSENEPVAAFLDQGMANSYAASLNYIDKISCCKQSRNSNGWHHDGDCKNWVLVY